MLLVLLVSLRPEWFTATPSAHNTPTTRQVKSSRPKRPPAHHRRAHLKTAEKPHATLPSTRHAPKKATVPAVAIAPVAHGYYAQLGAFHERSRAQGMADQLKHHGWHAVIATTRGGLNAVWVGPKSTRSSAETLLKSIQRKIKTRGFIVHHS